MVEGITRLDLTIPRGATWPAHAWVLLNDAGAALSAAPVDSTVVAKVRPRAYSDEILYTFTGSVVMLTIPGLYNGAPVAAVQLDQISHLVTAAWTWGSGEWDLMVGYEPVMTGTVKAPLMASR